MKKGPGMASLGERRAGGVFVGRERELSELLVGVDDALEGRGRLFLVAGEAGIGKSRLTDELAARAQDRGARVLYGRCWEAGGAPTYWPWVQAIRSWIRDQRPEALRVQLGAGAADFAQIVPDVREILGDVPPPAPLDPEVARFRLFEATASFLREASAAQPLLIVLDDLNVADTPSLLLLQFVAGELAESHILLICAYRDVDVSPGEALASTVHELTRQQVTRRLHLRGLGERDVARIIELSAGVAPPTGVVAALYQETEGNPLFLGETVRLLAEEGRLETLTTEPSWHHQIPESVREVIERRLQLLSEECKEVLTLASVVGREFGLEELEHFGDLAGDELLVVLDEAIGARVVSEVPGTLARLRFSHAVVRDVLYDALSTARRIRQHRRLGEVLEEFYASDPEPHLAELAHHFFQAAPGGDVQRAIDYTRRAGDRAAALYGNEDAVRLYRMSLEALDVKKPGDDSVRLELLLSLGEAQARSGAEAAAKATFLTAAEIAGRQRLPEQLARAALGYGGRFLWLRAGDDRHLVPLLEDALASLPERDSPTRVKLMGRLACARRSDPDREQAAAPSEQAVAMARRLGNVPTLAYALEAYYGAHFWYDNPRQRLELAAELAETAHESQDGERIAQAHAARMAALLELGRIREAEAALADMGRVADEIKQPAQRSLAAAVRSMLALFRGQLDQAVDVADEALRLGESSLTAEAEQRFRAHNCLLRREQGRFEGLEATMRRTAEEVWWYPMYRCFLAELYVDLDRRADARRLFDELVANDFEALLPRDNEWLVCATVLTDVCAYLGDVEIAPKLYDELLPVADLNVVGLAECARGSVERSLAVLATILGRRDDAEHHFLAALAANERMEARPWVARTQYEYAQLLLAWGAPGDRARARDLLDAALETARALGLATLAAHVESVGGQVSSAPMSTGAVFRREGEYWSIVYEGDAFRLRDSKGLRYLARLFEAPGEELHALELAGADMVGVREARIEDGLQVGGFGDAGELLDTKAKAAYRQRLDELEGELDEAEAWNDRERAARAREERSFIAGELSAAVGLGGRDRRAASAAERARVNVTRAIKSALARIDQHSPTLGAHLERTVRTGTFCSYSPDPDRATSWEL